MARRTHTLIPLGLVLMATKALAHGWEVGSSRLTHNSGMAMNTLPFDALHRQMPRMIEANVLCPLHGQRWPRREHLAHVAIVFMTIRAVLVFGVAELRVLYDLAVTTEASKALGLPRFATTHAKVFRVRKARNFSTTSEGGSDAKANEKQHKHG
jgi:hypothetical protein